MRQITTCLLWQLCFSASKLSFNRNIHTAFTSIPSSVVLHLHTRDSQAVRTIADEVCSCCTLVQRCSSLTIELNYVQLGRTTQTLDHVVVVHILIEDKRKSQINEYSVSCSK